MSGVLLSGCGFALPPREICCPSPTTSPQMQKGPATNILTVRLSRSSAPTAACGSRRWLHYLARSRVIFSCYMLIIFHPEKKKNQQIPTGGKNSQTSKVCWAAQVSSASCILSSSMGDFAPSLVILKVKEGICLPALGWVEHPLEMSLSLCWLERLV